ncbi:MAG TPA: DCC1-like thiol-disulfide oxidoreductase family protein [Bryobacteraceae bacterium]|nr:DCC1-like thiol-disulfide oxidoreductase family protein [Bryobacteraceae bacterium]
MEGHGESHLTNTPKFKVFYDDQCEICQAGVSWLRLLDRGNRTECVGIHPETIAPYPALAIDRCLQELHVITPEGHVLSGWDAVARLARLSPFTWVIGAAGAVPPFRWIGRLLYRLVAKNRYALSKCRGGACHAFRPHEVRRRTSLAPLWTCYSVGFLMRFPLSMGALVRSVARHIGLLWRTRGRRVEMLQGKLSLVFLNSFTCDLVSLMFGEQFLMVLYDGVAIDPGSTRMRRALERQLQRMPAGAIHAIAATHHHEEHSCNLNWLSLQTDAPVYVGSETAAVLRSPPVLPRIRRWMIGQPPPLAEPYTVLQGEMASATGTLEVIAAPGHCDDHIVLYDRREKLLIAGDTFMGAYFSAPNPDVDSRKWISTLERVLELEIEILVEGHGFVHTLRHDVPDFPGLVIRRHPREEIIEKLRFFEWLRNQIDSGLQEGLPLRAVEVTCFPWGQAFAWEQFANDELSRILSGGHWSRTELVRSFVRGGQEGVLPTVYQARFWRGKK